MRSQSRRDGGRWGALRRALGRAPQWLMFILAALCAPYAIPLMWDRLSIIITQVF